MAYIAIMMQSIRYMVLGFSAAFLVFPAGTAWAKQKTESPEIPVVTIQYEPSARLYAQSFDRNNQRETERRISASQAKSIAQSRVPGAKFVNVQMSGRDTYRVRLQRKDGKIVDVYVDARTGRVKN